MLFNLDEYFMGIAYKQAQQAFEEDEVPVGAIIVYNADIIAKAYNQTEKLNDTTAHAEMLAITAAANYIGGKYLNQCTMYVTLEPCPMCAGATSFARIRRLYYGASDEKSGAVESGVKYYNSETCHHKPEVYSGILETECSTILKEFFSYKRS